MSMNPAPGKVMQKSGLKYEGTLESHVVKWENTMICSIMAY